MTDKKYIAIIYEGEKTESQLLNNLNKNFFKDISELVPIMFPAGENIGSSAFISVWSFLISRYDTSV